MTSTPTASDAPASEAPDARTRAVTAAFELFDERGFDGTTVDQIAERAGISRSTYFRLFATKEDVIFPDHDDLHRRIQARLSAAGGDASVVAVSEAARMVLDHFLAEGDLARSRYRLTRTVPALRGREIAGMHGYQRIFREFIRGWMVPSADAELRSELMANAVVTAHNVVLRRWLRGLTDRPHQEFDAAIREVVSLFSPRSGDDETTVVVLRSGGSFDAVVPLIREALAQEPPTTTT